VEPNGLERRSRGRRAALALLVVTVAAAAVSAYLQGRHIVDSWWMRKLLSTDRETRNLAAEKLAERKCLRAVPEILRLIAADAEEEVVWYAPMHKPGKPEFTRLPGPPVEDPRRVDVRYATPLVLALWNMGEDAIPVIEKAALDRMEDGRLRFIVENLRDRLWLRPEDASR